MPQPPAHLEDLLHEAYRYACALTHDPTAAEELVQQACLSVIQAGGTWSRAYLLRAVRSRFYDRHRRESAPHYARPSTNGRLEPSTTAPPGESRLLEHEAMTQLDTALAKLDPPEREILFLHCALGLTARQIARHLQRPRGTVLSILQRSREKLSRLLSLDPCEVSP